MDQCVIDCMRSAAERFLSWGALRGGDFDSQDSCPLAGEMNNDFAFLPGNLSILQRRRKLIFRRPSQATRQNRENF